MQTTKTKSPQQIGGYWIRNNGIVREVINNDMGRKFILEKGDLLAVPKGDRNLHLFANSAQHVMRYEGPLVGQVAHLRLPGENRYRAREMTEEIVASFDPSLWTRHERENREESKEAKEAKGSGRGRK